MLEKDNQDNKVIWLLNHGIKMNELLNFLQNDFLL